MHTIQLQNGFTEYAIVIFIVLSSNCKRLIDNCKLQEKKLECQCVILVVCLLLESPLKPYALSITF